MGDQDYVVVVPPTEPEEAKRLYESWLSERPRLKARLRDEDVLIDMIRVKGGVAFADTG
jgi:hypothetical protein